MNNLVLHTQIQNHSSKIMILTMNHYLRNGQTEDQDTM